MSTGRADISVPPKCRKMVRSSALVVINTNGGKYRQAMTTMLSRVVTLAQLVAVRRTFSRTPSANRQREISRALSFWRRMLIFLGPRSPINCWAGKHPQQPLVQTAGWAGSFGR